MPAKRVARLGAAICAALDMTCSVRSCSRPRAIASALLGVFLRSLGLPFDCAARRWARFGLVSCIWFPLDGGGIASDRAALCGPTSSDT